MRDSGIRVAVTFQGAEAEAVRELQTAGRLESVEAVIVLGLWHLARHYGLDLPREVFDLERRAPYEYPDPNPVTRA